ncbi:hypothetical protein KIPB_003022 [Kipferlia bialata]|uniref:Uncharacterized protein n=1 Tax=Kipferlia bialata TaxID=797122 RepID=A0A9K3CT87_9EUKA|nr:hypothetical protein KIPB_003022 [Kipferlia bialata]|eukprot:g3022.t1
MRSTQGGGGTGGPGIDALAKRYQSLCMKERVRPLTEFLRQLQVSVPQNGTLNLSGSFVSAADLGPMFQVLQQCPQAQHIVLSKNKLGAEAAEPLARYLAPNTRILSIEVRLVHCGMSMTPTDHYSYGDAHREQGAAMGVRAITLTLPRCPPVPVGAHFFRVDTLLTLGGSSVLLGLEDNEFLVDYEYIIDLGNCLHQRHCFPTAIGALQGDRIHHSSPALINGTLTRYVVINLADRDGVIEDGRRFALIHDLADPLSPPKRNSEYSSQYISESGVIMRLPLGMTMHVQKYMMYPLTCVLDGQCVFVPGEQYSLKATMEGIGTCIYNPETQVWTEDGRECPDLTDSKAHTVVDDTLYVFTGRNGEGGIWTYTLEDGWENVGRLPMNSVGVAFAQTFGRLILLGCDSGIHLHDTVSGDWSRIGDNPHPEPEIEDSSYIGACITHNTLLCLDTTSIVDNDDRLLYASIVTLNESLLYPSVEMGWGRLLEWDKDWRVTLGVDNPAET